MFMVRIHHVQVSSAFYNLKIVTECILNKFWPEKDLLVKRRSNGKVEHHAGVAVKAAFKKEMIKYKDIRSRRTRGTRGSRSQTSFLVVGMLQLSLTKTSLTSALQESISIFLRNPREVAESLTRNIW